MDGLKIDISAKHISFCIDFAAKIKPLQEQLLILQKKKLRTPFEKLYSDCLDHFNRARENFAGTGRESKYFILKKQVDLIIRFIENLNSENLYLYEMNEQEVLFYFEKQFRLKKIIKKHIEDLKKLQWQHF